MILALITLFTALAISAVAAFYSIVGLMAIFSASALSIAIMGAVLEVGKLITASWLYQNWKNPLLPKSIKYYLTTSVVVLVFVTSMGIFGFLSKAHVEQSSMSMEQIALVDSIEEKLIRSEAKIDRWDEEIKRLLI